MKMQARYLLLVAALFAGCEAKPVDPKKPLFDANAVIAGDGGGKFNPGASGKKSTASFHTHKEHRLHLDFKELDENSDGAISEEELTKGLWRDRSVSLGKFREADKNGDGVLKEIELTEIEGKDSEGKDRNFVEFMSTIFKNDLHHKFPLNTDSISWKEYQGAVEVVWQHENAEKLREYDANKDGSLDTEEYHKLFVVLQKEAKDKLFGSYSALSKDHESGDMSSDEWFEMVWEKRFDMVKVRALEFFKDCDTNGDDKMTLEEYKNHEEADKFDVEKYEKQFYGWVPEGAEDRNVVTLEQVLKAVDAQFGEHALETFNIADENQDGLVSKEEFERVDNHGFHLEL